MKVFISWSGESSHQVALIFRDWLPTVMQMVQPWVSSEDILKGKRWAVDLMQELENVAYGIICVDSSNFTSAWLNFEAGAISKQVSSSFVAPFLFHVEPSQVIGPLSLFQATRFSKEEVYKLLRSINEACGPDRIAEEKIQKSLDFSWATFKAKLNDVSLPSLNTTGSSNPKPITKSYKLSPSDIKLMKYLAAAKEAGPYWVEPNEIAKHMSESNNRVDYDLRNLERLGLVWQHQLDGKWGIQDRGIDFLFANGHL